MTVRLKKTSATNSARNLQLTELVIESQRLDLSNHLKWSEKKEKATDNKGGGGSFKGGSFKLDGSFKGSVEGMLR